jgi:hypothetical protein
MSEARIAAFVESQKALFAQTEADLEKQLAQQKAQQYLQGAQMAVSALTTIFGESKATAYAQAVINTAEGVTEALTLPFPLDFVVAALIAAAGAVQISKISSTNVGGGRGGGFDDPVNDMLARSYGRKWAQDFTREVDAGFHAEMRAGGGRQTNVISHNTKVDRGTHVGTLNMNGMMGTPEQALLAFNRRLIKIQRVEQRTERSSR